MYEIILKDDQSKVYNVENPCFCRPMSDGGYHLVDENSANCLYLQETGLYYYIEGRYPVVSGVPAVFLGTLPSGDVLSYKEMTASINSNSECLDDITATTLSTQLSVQDNSDAIDDILEVILKQ